MNATTEEKRVEFNVLMALWAHCENEGGQPVDIARMEAKTATSRKVKEVLHKIVEKRWTLQDIINRTMDLKITVE